MKNRLTICQSLLGNTQKKQTKNKQDIIFKIQKQKKKSSFYLSLIDIKRATLYQFKYLNALN